jgi:DNA polymerase III delta prime subunit
MKMKNCKKCGKRLYSDNKTGYCISCLKEKTNADKIQHWLQTGETGCGVNTTLRNCIRDYLYKQQNNQCAICSLNRIWNNKNLNFILDHIDGDASNNNRSNLRLICPNCDSQLDTFKSKNKKSARNR